jgi:hypothetical protein
MWIASLLSLHAWIPTIVRAWTGGPDCLPHVWIRVIVYPWTDPSFHMWIPSFVHAWIGEFVHIGYLPANQ